MELTIYADLLFATNFLMDLVILFLTIQLSRIRFHLGRLSIAAGLMALYGTVTFLPDAGFLVSFLGKSVMGILAIWILAPEGGLFGFIKARIILSLVSAGLGGVVYGLVAGTEFGRSLKGISVNGTVYYMLDMRVLLAGIFLCYILLLWFRKCCVRNFSRDNILVSLALKVGEERINLTALSDTGCELTAPGTGEGVLLVSETVLRGVVPKNSFWLPIHTASGDDRIPAFYPDDVECLSLRYQLEEKPLVGIVGERFSKDGLYSGILNPQIISEKNQDGGNYYENEVSEVLTTLARNIAKMANHTAQKDLLHRRRRKSSVSPWKRGRRDVSCPIGYPGGARGGAQDSYRAESATGCVHSTKI